MHSTAATQRRRLIRTILFTSLWVALLDIAAAILTYYIINHRIPFRIFQYIASAAVGSTAFSRGIEMNLLGILFHFFIAAVFTFLFFIFYSALPILSKNKIGAGLLYGVLIWIVMNLVVLPLTFLPKAKFEFTQIAIAIFTLMICVGLPISISAYNYFTRGSLHNK